MNEDRDTPPRGRVVSSTQRLEELPVADQRAYKAQADFDEHAFLARKRGMFALQRLADKAMGDTHQPRHVRRILLATYDGDAWPLNINRLRLLDADLIRDALAVIEWATYASDELYEHLPDGEDFMRKLADIELSSNNRTA